MHIFISLHQGSYHANVLTQNSADWITGSFPDLEKLFMYVSSCMIEYGHEENEVYNEQPDAYDVDQYEIHHMIDNSPINDTSFTNEELNPTL